jgi:hypothetical protein
MSTRSSRQTALLLLFLQTPVLLPVKVCSSRSTPSFVLSNPGPPRSFCRSSHFSASEGIFPSPFSLALFKLLSSTHHTESDPIGRGFHQNKTQQKKNFDRIPRSSTKQKPLTSTAIAKTKIHPKNQTNKAKKDSPTLTPGPEIYDPERRHLGGKEEGGKKKTPRRRRRSILIPVCSIPTTVL